MACSRAVLIVLVAFLFASTWLYFTWRSFTKDPAKQMHQSALRTSPSAAAGNSSTPMSQTAAGNWTTATPAAMSENRDATSANFAQSRRAAVIIVGHARTLSWDIVCDNIKTRLLDALAKPPESELETYTKWHVEVQMGAKFPGLEQEQSSIQTNDISINDTGNNMFILLCNIVWIVLGPEPRGVSLLVACGR